jgi:methionyl-tRNA formyltransferase
VRAFNPWPGTWFVLPGTKKNTKETIRVKVLAASVVADNKNKKPGTVMDDQLTIACKDGALRLKRLQREGKGAMDMADFLRGNELPAGTVLD